MWRQPKMRLHNTGTVLSAPIKIFNREVAASGGGRTCGTDIGGLGGTPAGGFRCRLLAEVRREHTDPSSALLVARLRRRVPYRHARTTIRPTTVRCHHRPRWPAACRPG